MSGATSSTSTPVDGYGAASADPDAVAGRGLWIANQLCDLVQLRSHDGGTAVRLHVRRGDADARDEARLSDPA